MKVLQDVERAAPIAACCGEHLDKKTRDLLNMWRNLIDENEFFKIAILLSDDKFQDSLIELSRVFFIGGYTSAMDDIKNGIIDV